MADFVNGRYYDGVSEVTATDIIEETAYGSWSFDQITGSGLESGDDATPSFKGNLLNLILAGATVVFDFSFSGPNSNLEVDIFDLPDFSTFTGVQFKVVDACSFYAPGVGEEFPTLGGGNHRAAITMIENKIAAALDGALAFSQEFTPATTPNAFGFGLLNPGAVVRSVTIHPPQDDANLPALSA